MSGLKLTKTGLANGVWQGVLTGAGDQAPRLQVTCDGHPIDGITLQHDQEAGLWQVALPIPSQLINDGLQTILIRDEDGETLCSIALLAGDALADDLRSEIDLLRNELDLLKGAFRAHCRDSA
ncbi:hypothetical protein [Yoonia sp. BS5-3]|uniref:Uncharacterized protein n=1 Tax=Yoonia phaeophyticola TaxID=3137369 RepID=A0ABZ2V5F6_9RHOB